LERDDEFDFMNKVDDYDVYKKDIDKLKNTLHPAQRAQKNLHRTLYINVKSADKRVAERIYKKVEDEKPVSPDGEAPPPSPGVEPVVVERPAARGPKPAPPLAAPTPANRPAPNSQQNARKSKLVPTDKIRSFCRANNQDIDAYMLKLEDNGETQESVNNAGQLGRREQPRSVYDRPRAAR
jgi:hypothetical protein